MSATPKVNLTINQGATFRHKFAWKDKNGRPIDLTNFIARMQVRASASSPVVLLELTTENGGLALGGKLGTIALYLTDNSTGLIIDWVRGVYDIELVSPAGDVFRVVAGTAVVSPQITK